MHAHSDEDNQENWDIICLSYIYRYMFINYEREIIIWKLKSDLQSSCLPFTPSLFSFFPPDSIDNSIFSGLVDCAEICKIFLLVCRCCKITFPFSGVMIPRSHTHEGTCEKRSITPLGDMPALAQEREKLRNTWISSAAKVRCRPRLCDELVKY